MMRPHDLLWIDDANALSFDGVEPEWVSTQWHNALPLVVRRDRHQAERIPVGVRGRARSQRAAAWLAPEAVLRIATPESLVAQSLADSAFIAMVPLQALLALALLPWRWAWGVTGSCGYALASGLPVMHADSDLDLLIRCPQLAENADLRCLEQQLQALPCRVDAQIETPYGGFALAEWLRDGRVLLKTNGGPYLTRQPWSAPQE